MKNLTRIMILVVSIAMVVSLFAGCAGKTEASVETDNGSATKENTVNETNEAEPTASPEAEEVWYGNADGTPITLQVWGGVQPEYGYDQIMVNFNEEFAEVGIQAEYVRYVNNAEGNLQVDTYLMSGGEIDVLVGYGAEQLLNRADSGLLLNITDKLAEAGFDSEAELGAASMSQYWGGRRPDLWTSFNLFKQPLDDGKCGYVLRRPGSRSPTKDGLTENFLLRQRSLLQAKVWKKSTA